MPGKPDIQRALKVAEENLQPGEHILVAGLTLPTRPPLLISFPGRLFAITFLLLIVLGIMSVNSVLPGIVAAMFGFVLIVGGSLCFFYLCDVFLNLLADRPKQVTFITNKRLLAVEEEDLKLTVLCKKSEIAKIQYEKTHIELTMEGGSKLKFKVFEGLTNSAVSGLL